MYVLIIERLLHKVEVVGPFEHEELAREYAERNVGPNIWRIAKLTPPPSIVK